MGSPKSLTTLARLRARDPNTTRIRTRAPKLRIKFRARYESDSLLFVYELGRCGGKGRLVFAGDAWPSKGFWLLYWTHAGYLYRIWSAECTRREARAWLAWSRSSAFQREHAVSIDDAAMAALPNAERPFRTNPRAPAEGVWLGWRRRLLRPQPGDFVPDWIHNYSRRGCSLQRYTSEEVRKSTLLSFVSRRD